MDKHPKKKILIAVAVLLGLAGVGATIWYKMYRLVPQPAWITADQRDNYFYGSLDAAQTAGLPYWIWLELPRMFPEYMPGPGGYAALGLSWEEGKEMPVGFAKQRIGYIRVTGNCALCHAVSDRAAAADVPTITAAVRGHSTDIQPLLTFLTRCAQDPRFNADEILAQVDTATKLSLADRLLYRYILIPLTRRSLLDPASTLFAPALRTHSREPQSSAPFSEQPMKGLRQQMTELEASVTSGAATM
jgi:hypothetical protein